MKRNGIEFPFLWSVVKDLTNSMIVVNRLTQEYRLVDKV